MKKLIISLIICFVLFIGLEWYQSQKTVECWWGVLYPALSFIAVEDDSEDNKTQISSLNPQYVYVNYEEEPIKMKIAIVEWFKNTFKKGE